MYNDIIGILRMANLSPNKTGLIKPKWNHLPTTVIRVPECFSSELLNTAKALDEGKDISVQRYYEELTPLNPSDNLAANPPALPQVIQLLTESLNYKANAGGKIKNRIREALELLGANDKPTQYDWP